MSNSKKRTRIIAACGLVSSVAALALSGHHGVNGWTLAGIVTGLVVGLIVIARRRRV